MDFQALLTRLRALAATFTTAQLVSLAVTFVLVVGIVVGSAWWLGAPNYTLLFADMDPESAADIVTRLKTMKVDYQLDEGGRAIRVPSNQVDELRLQLTAQGLPSSGRIGFEIFDRTAFGATEFLEKVNYRRALEGEIARTIATISEVASARVHIAIGKETLFGEPRPSKASVVLRLRNSRGLSAGTVSGIANLVAASVEGLRPENVVIVDSHGRPLSQPTEEGADALGAAQLEKQQRLERELITRVTALLEPVVGAGRVRVNAAVLLDSRSREETQELWDPNTVVRSRHTTADTSTAPNAAIGIAGSRANMPPPPQDPKAPAPPEGSATAMSTAAGTSRTSETTNYEVSKTTSRTVKPSGDIARLSVAVIIDDEHVEKKTEDGKTNVERRPRDREELQKLHGLVAAAVGLDPARGDQLTVENISFEESPGSMVESPQSEFMMRYGPYIKDGVRILAVLVLGLTAILVVIRPLMTRAVARPATAAAAAAAAAVTAPVLDRPRTVAELESEIEAQLEAAASEKAAESRRLPVLTRHVKNLATKEPEQTAKLLRSWLTEQER